MKNEPNGQQMGSTLDTGIVCVCEKERVSDLKGIVQHFVIYAVTFLPRTGRDESGCFHVAV